jgi:hypothetical protein
MKSQGRASEPAQVKIGTRRLEEQPGKAVETADSPVRHTVRLTTADREVTIPVFLFQFPGVNVGSADGGSGVNIQPILGIGLSIVAITVQATYGWRTTYGLLSQKKNNKKGCWYL